VECGSAVVLRMSIGADIIALHASRPDHLSSGFWRAPCSGCLAALRVALTYRRARAEIEIDGACTTAPAVLIVVSNVELYAGYFHLALDARLDDGWLNVSAC